VTQTLPIGGRDGREHDKFEIPNEMRAVAERSVEQAKLAFNNHMRASEETVSASGARVEASQVGAGHSQEGNELCRA
jgi:hypothetical protein